MGQARSMFETLTLTTILLILFFTFQNYRLGLTSTIPKDPEMRMKFYCSECLTNLKGLLAQATIEELHPESLLFRPRGSQETHQLQLREGDVMMQKGQSSPSRLTTLGNQGSLSFERVSDTGLIVKILASAGEATHQAALRLDVTYQEAIA